MEKFNDTASIIKLNYAKAEELKTALAPLIGTNSKISTDTVTNILPYFSRQKYIQDLYQE